jgi:hypothetical protein
MVSAEGYIAAKELNGDPDMNSATTETHQGMVAAGPESTQGMKLGQVRVHDLR